MGVDKKKVSAVIISFNPEMDNLTRLIKSLKQQDVNSIVVDNGTLTSEMASFLTTLCEVVLLEKNVGIAKAQNEGIKYAKKNDAEFIIFFDQDSCISHDFVDSLLLDYTSLIESGVNKIASIGPVFTDSRYGFYYKVIKLNKLGFRDKIDPQFRTRPFEVTLIISSGSLVPTAVFDDVGYMDEHLFIDYVDTEWCLRAVDKGYKIYVATSAKMAHAIGDKMVSLLGFNVPVHSSFRRYYRIRNALIFLRMAHVPFALKIRDNIFNVIHQVILIITQKNKLGYVRSMLKGLRDGLLNR